ncbi:putative palmitoyltransferase ZDHHC24 isoform X1 [Tenrec ecaudatus]|uniref:putative palmitoyltransferase ZDHHC24 isoform X1 n=1 Tax=Tenrec ecaudatus TaxID=94439 RepID=UPI003F59B238
MVLPWAAGSAEGAPARLPLALTALWAAAVGLELAYVLVLGPGPPPLGPLARALQLALAAFQLLNLLGNLGLFLRSDPSIRGVMLAGRGLGRGWAYCYQCQSQVPPRSGHCFACRVCILRRDHHCRLLGCCVGFHNYRPFLCLLLHTALVLLHISVLLGPAVLALLQAHSPLQATVLLLLPWLMLFTAVQTHLVACHRIPLLCLLFHLSSSSLRPNSLPRRVLAFPFPGVDSVLMASGSVGNSCQLWERSQKLTRAVGSPVSYTVTMSRHRLEGSGAFCLFICLFVFEWARSAVQTPLPR